MATAILLNGGEGARKRFEEALAPLDATLHIVSLGAGSSKYDEKKGIASRYTLEEYVREIAPEWRPGDELVLMAFSAGVWAPRAWMRDPPSRDLVSALVLLDGLHSPGHPPGTGGCHLSTIHGVVAYAREAPSRGHVLVVTNSEVDPGRYAGTSACAELLLDQLTTRERPRPDEGAGDGFVVLDADVSHDRHQWQLGPQVVADYVVPTLLEARRPSVWPFLAGAGLVLFAGATVAAFRRTPAW